MYQILSLCKERLKNYGDYEFFKSIQVLTPTKKGKLGTRELKNAELKRNKAAFMQMLSMIAQRQKTSVKELGEEVEQEVSKTYGDDLSQLDKYKNGIEVLKGMVKKTTANIHYDCQS